MADQYQEQSSQYQYQSAPPPSNYLKQQNEPPWWQTGLYYTIQVILKVPGTIFKIIWTFFNRYLKT